jgi:hypothetical protein
MAESTHEQQTTEDDDSTELPVLKSWPAVYGFVLGTFVVWIVLLTALSRAFS